MTTNRRLSLFATLASISLAAACGGAVSSNNGGDGGTGAIVSADGIGSPCVPFQESKSEFSGFVEQEVALETSPGDPSGAPVCLINHFRGRVTCPYGQYATGEGPPGAAACTAGSGGAPVTGDARTAHGSQVQAQCVDRLAANVVIRSCRCANNSGKTDDGDNYCACPNGMTCESMLSSIGPSTAHLAGSYCIKAGTAYDRSSACAEACDPSGHSCP